MYEKDYAETWIQHHESGDDEYRTTHLNPYLKEKITSLTQGKILDVGCGWGQSLEYIQNDVKYHGIDVVPEFFTYIKNRYSDKMHNITLSNGSLPNDVPSKDKESDMVVCCMVLHTVSDLKQSIKTLHSKIKPGGKLVIITFNDNSPKYLKSCFKQIDHETKISICGEFVLPSKNTIQCEIFFHKENDYKTELDKHGPFTTRPLGPLFVAYEYTK